MAFAWILAKKSIKELRVYSIELMDEKKLRSTLDSESAIADSDAPIRSFEEII